MGATVRVLAIPRILDAMPIGGIPVFGSVTGAVPADSALHALATPAGLPALPNDGRDRLRLNFFRAEWSAIDATVPPPLTLSALVDGQSSTALNALSALMLLPVTPGTPALEFPIFADLNAGAALSIAVRNTGAVAQVVSVYVSGWLYPESLDEGAGYGPTVQSYGNS